MTDSIEKDFSEILLSVFYEDKILIREDRSGFVLPRFQVTGQGSYKDLIRRNVYELNGALISKTELLGSFFGRDDILPIFVALVVNIDTASQTYKTDYKFISISALKYRPTIPYMTQDLLSYFLYHSFKAYRKIAREEFPRDIYKRDFYF